MNQNLIKKSYVYVIAVITLLALPLIGLAQVNVESDLNAEVEVGASNNTEATSTEESSEVESDSESSSNLELGLNNFGIAVSNSAQVNSGLDLNVFVNNFSLENEGVASVEVSSNDDDESMSSEVSVTHNHRANFLGFIPVNMKSKTTIISSADGDIIVKVSTPWWSFLTAKSTVDKSELQSRIESNSSIRANASVGASAQMKAQAIEQIVAEIQSHTRAKVEASSESSL